MEFNREILSGVFSSLGHPTRVGIFDTLSMYSPANLSFIARVLSKSDSHVSHHIQILLDSGIVKRTQAGRYASFIIDPMVLKDSIQFLGQILLKGHEDAEARRNDHKVPTPEDPNVRAAGVREDSSGSDVR